MAARSVIPGKVPVCLGPASKNGEGSCRRSPVSLVSSQCGPNKGLPGWNGVVREDRLKGLGVQPGNLGHRLVSDPPRGGLRRSCPDVLGTYSNSRINRRERVVCSARRAGDFEDPYVILGVPRGATEKEIKTAYRKKALKFHPDVNKAPNAQEQFLRIKRAYQALTEPDTARRGYQPSSGGAGRTGSGRNAADYGYDEWQKAWRQSAKKAEEDFYGLEDLFRDLASDAAKKKKGGAASSSGTKSLWEELADIGEEFVEFLEQSIATDNKDPSQTKSSASKYYDEMFGDAMRGATTGAENSSSTGSSSTTGSSATGSSNASGSRPKAGPSSSSSSSTGSKPGGSSSSTSRSDDSDIDELLSKMKKNLGL